MITEWFDRDGHPISIVEASDKLGDPLYCIVARDIWDGITVSTVWVGTDHASHWVGDQHHEPERPVGAPPLIFETRIFGGPYNGHVWHYPTQADAIVGHDRIAAEVLTALGHDHDHTTTEH